MFLAIDKEKARKFVRFSYINEETKLPDFSQAGEDHLLPILGDTLYEKLQEIAATIDAPADPKDETYIRDQQLLRKCQAVVVPLAYLSELPTINISITDNGLQSDEKAPHRWEYNKVEAQLADKGSKAIESLLHFLFRNQDHYEEWTESEEYQQCSSLIFKTGKEFNEYYTLHQPHRLYWKLRPQIRTVENFYIKPSIGDAFYKALKAKANLSDEEKNALDLIKSAVAQYTILLATEQLSVKISEHGFTVLIGENNSESLTTGERSVLPPELTTLAGSCQRQGDSYILQLQEYLNSKASETVFADYFNSQHYVNPSQTDSSSGNANRKSIVRF